MIKRVKTSDRGIKTSGTSQLQINNEYPRSRTGYLPWVIRFGPTMGQIGPKGTNPGLLQIRFQYIFDAAPKCTESDLKKSRICPIWGQSDLFLAQI